MTRCSKVAFIKVSVVAVHQALIKLTPARVRRLDPANLRAGTRTRHFEGSGMPTPKILMTSSSGPRSGEDDVTPGGLLVELTHGDDVLDLVDEVVLLQPEQVD